jgi:hypothetical protein
VNKPITRRNVLAGTGYLGTAGLLHVLPAWAQAPATAPASLPPVCITNYYMAGEGSKFNRLEYREKHLPLLRSLFGDALDRIELRTAPPRERKRLQGHTEAAVPESPILAIESVWIKNLEAYATAARGAGDKVGASMKEISSGKIAVQYEQLIAAKGEARESVTQGSSCFVSLYPSKDEGKWDAAYYTYTYLPMMMEAYGPDAIRRVEVCKGVSVPGGGKPVFLSAVNVYIKDQQAYFRKGMQAGPALMKEGMKISTIFPVMGSYEVYAVG